MSNPIPTTHQPFDQPIIDIVDYALTYEITSPLAYETARYCLLDTLGCGLQALDFPACTKLLGPLVPGLAMTNGARVPAPPSSSTPYKPPSISAPSSAGSTTTTPG